MEFEVGGQTYQTKKMNAFDQAKLLKRVAPVVSSLINENVLTAIKDKPKEEIMYALLQPFCTALAKIPDEDLSYVMNACLNVTERKSVGGWAKVLATRDKVMFEDIGLPEMFQIVGQVMMENLSGFFPASP